MTDHSSPESLDKSPVSYSDLSPLAQAKVHGIGMQLLHYREGTLWSTVPEPLRTKMVDRLLAQVEEFGEPCIDEAIDRLKS